MNEQQIQKKILDWLDAQGYQTYKTITTNKRGTPDILACSPTGHFVAIEVKAPKKLSTVSKLQQYHLDEINRRGGTAFAADSLEKVKSVLTRS